MSKPYYSRISNPDQTKFVIGKFHSNHEFDDIQDVLDISAIGIEQCNKELDKLNK